MPNPKSHLNMRAALLLMQTVMKRQVSTPDLTAILSMDRSSVNRLIAQLRKLGVRIVSVVPGGGTRAEAYYELEDAGVFNREAVSAWQEQRRK